MCKFSAGRCLISFLLTFQVILSCFFLECFSQGGRWSSNFLSHFFLFSKETLLFQYSCQLVFTVSRQIHVLFFIFSVLLFIIYYLKKLFYASNIHILNPSCYLASSSETFFTQVKLTSSGNYICHQGSGTLLHLWNISRLLRNSSASWSLWLSSHLWSCVSLGRSQLLHFSLNLYRVGNSALRYI